MFRKILLLLSFTLSLSLATQAEGPILEKKWGEDRAKTANSEQIKSNTQLTKPIRVYVDVVADLMHAGHVEFFKKAKAMGNYLIVGVLSDADVASYKRTPILTLEERVAAVQACRYVDEVIAAPPMRVDEKWLKEHQIDFLVHGDDFDEKTMEWWYGAAMKMGIFRSVPYTKGISTTNIIKRITDRNLGNPPPQK
jgi:cytidyltransferase-like protein